MVMGMLFVPEVGGKGGVIYIYIIYIHGIEIGRQGERFRQRKGKRVFCMQSMIYSITCEIHP